MAFCLLSLPAMACALSGCIVAGPPDYKDPTQTPPVLDLSGAEPSVREIQTASPNDQMHFSVPVRSEDAGDDLEAVLYLDYTLPSQSLQDRTFTTVPASTFDDTKRTVAFTWTVPQLAPGCRQLTLLVTHKSNFFTRNQADIALATWWLNVSDQIDAQHPYGTNPLGQCPTSTGGSS